jgi:hypothetical protein
MTDSNEGSYVMSTFRFWSANSIAHLSRSLVDSSMDSVFVKVLGFQIPSH